MSQELRPVLLLHKEQEYCDRVVYLSGHAYKKCTFTRCTLVVRAEPFRMEHCTIESCVWHIDSVMHDRDGVERLRAMLCQIEKSVPQSRGVGEGTSQALPD